MAAPKLYLWTWLSNDPKQRLGIRTLQVALGLVFIFRAFTELPFAAYLYGVNGIGNTMDYEIATGNFVGLALTAFFGLKFAPHFLLMVLAICGICYVVEYRTRTVTVLSLVTFNLISSRNTALGDGGDNITQIVLVYMLLLIPFSESFKEASLKVWLHNLGVVAIGVQIMILYFTAGFMKINGDVWTSGIALFNISQVEAFSIPYVREAFKNPYVATISAYTTMIFLVWFPIAMFSRLKLFWILIGVSFHVGILGFMGLVTFAITMIGMELFFVTDLEYKHLGDIAKRFNKLPLLLKFTRYLGKSLTKKHGTQTQSSV